MAAAAKALPALRQMHVGSFSCHSLALCLRFVQSSFHSTMFHSHIHTQQRTLKERQRNPCAFISSSLSRSPTLVMRCRHRQHKAKGHVRDCKGWFAAAAEAAAVAEQHALLVYTVTANFMHTLLAPCSRHSIVYISLYGKTLVPRMHTHLSHTVSVSLKPYVFSEQSFSPLPTSPSTLLAVDLFVYNVLLFMPSLNSKQMFLADCA